MGKWINWNRSSQVQQQHKVTGLWGMQYRYAARPPARKAKKIPPFKTLMPMTDEVVHDQMGNPEVGPI